MYNSPKAEKSLFWKQWAASTDCVAQVRCAPYGSCFWADRRSNLPNYSLAKVFPGFLHWHSLLELGPSATNITHLLTRWSKNLGQDFFSSLLPYTLLATAVHLILTHGLNPRNPAKKMAFARASGSLCCPPTKRQMRGRRDLWARDDGNTVLPQQVGELSPAPKGSKRSQDPDLSLIPMNCLLRMINSLKDFGELPLPYSSSLLSFKQFSPPLSKRKLNCGTIMRVKWSYCLGTWGKPDPP